MADLTRIPKHLFFIIIYFALYSHLIFQPVKPCPDGHWLDMTLTVDPVVVAAGLAEGLVKASLELLYIFHEKYYYFLDFSYFFKKK